MKSRSLAWFSPGLLIVIVALVFETGDIAKAQAPQQPFVQAVGTLPVSSADGTTQFVLRAPADRIAAIAARHGLTVIGPADEHAHDVFLVSGPATFFNGPVSGANGDTTARALVENVQSDPDVAHFEPNAIVVTPEVPIGIDLNHSTVEILDALSAPRTLTNYFGAQAWTSYTNQPAATAIRLAESHAVSGTGVGIVAIIDTGIDPDHPLLQGSLVPGYDFVNDTEGASEWNDLNHSTVEILDHSTVEILDSAAAPVPLNPSTVAILNSASTLDPDELPAAFGHGTMVAGVVHLIAPTAKIMPLKAFHSDGTSRLFDIIRAVYYAVDNGARVINMSFSSTVSSPELARAIDYATNNGVVCVASAGNLGQEVVVYPGALRNVLGIASSNSAITAPVKSTFTNFGDALVSLAAPGEAVITTYPGGGYAGVWGTSFAAPLVAGGAALLLQIDPTLNQHKADGQFGKAIPMAPGMGKGRLNLYEAVRTLPDATPPVVSMISPANGGAVTGSVLIAASASDNVSVAGVKFLLDDNLLAEDTVAPFEMPWSTTTAANGNHVVTAIARDAAGNVASSATSVTVSNDTEAPTVALTSPAAGGVVGGTVTLSAAASDNVGITSVLFKLDGVALGVEDTNAPYELAWSTDPVSDGAHALTVVARDAAGNETTSSVVSVTVTHDVTAPAVAVTAPAAGATVGDTVTVTATASDNVGVTSVQFFLDGAALGGTDTAAPYETAWSTGTAANGTHTLTAVARDAAGHETTASAVSVTVTNDTAAPTVALTSPGAGTTLGGSVSVIAAASDDVGVVSVQFLLDGAPLGEADVAPPYEVAWPTTTAANGAHTLTALARDAAGHETTSAAVVVAVTNDTAAPTVSLTSPAASTTISGAVTVTATASDDVGVTSVQFLLDGEPLGAPDGSEPYEVSWSTTSVPNGAHTLTAVARDGAEHETTASNVSVTVTNDLAAPTVAVTSPTAGTTVGGTVTLTATAADDVSVVGVQFKLDGVAVGAEDAVAPYELPWSTTTTSNGAHTVTAVARDAVGHEAENTVSVTVMNDTTAPTVALSSPTAGATVGGTVTVTASASDDVGVVSVQFLLDGAPLGAADSSAPYEVAWATASEANGAHTLAAVARDAAGHESTSTVSVAVMNDTTPPAVSLTSPAAGTTVGGSVTLTATASDNVGVASVQFLLDGSPLGAADGAAPYTLAWSTSSVANGEHTLSAIARDAAGHETTAATVNVTVFNDTTAPTVTLTNPAVAAVVNGIVTITATAADNVSVVSVEFLLDGVPLGLGAVDTAAPYEAEWLTTTVANGAHTVTAVARDAAGNESTAIAAVIVTNLPD